MIPSKVNILGHTIKIKRVKKIPGKGMAMNRGLWVPDKNLIYVVYNPSNHDLENSTFYHELLHALLDFNGYEKLSSDEKFVEAVSLTLHQVMKDIYHNEK